MVSKCWLLCGVALFTTHGVACFVRAPRCLVNFVLRPYSGAILFLNAFFVLFRLLPMTCLLTVLVLARLSLAVGVVGGPALILADRRGLVTVRAGRGSALALPLSIIWGCLGLSPRSTLSLRM